MACFSSEQEDDGIHSILVLASCVKYNYKFKYEVTIIMLNCVSTHANWIFPKMVQSWNDCLICYSVQNNDDKTF